jgi:hypothetical protein
MANLLDYCTEHILSVDWSERTDATQNDLIIVKKLRIVCYELANLMMLSILERLIFVLLCNIRGLVATCQMNLLSLQVANASENDSEFPNIIIDLLIESKEKCIDKGYTNLTLWVSENSGLVDMSIHGDRGFTEEEKDVIERIQVITRIKDKTSKGLTRDELLK